MDELKTNVTDKVIEIKDEVIDTFNDLIRPVKDVFNEIWKYVKPIADKLANVFDFDWELPDIDLPHFSISPSGWQMGDLLKGSIPKLSVSWWADGGIMTNPTAFGINGNNLMVGGEAGAEAILPLSKLWSELGKQFDKQNQILSNNSNSGNVTITLAVDGKELARATTKGMSDLARIGALNMDFL